VFQPGGAAHLTQQRVRDLFVQERSPVGVALPDGPGQPSGRTTASRLWSLVSGNSCTSAATPSTLTASRRFNSAAPQASINSRWSGSAAGSSLAKSARTSIVVAVQRNRHGWVLCSDGAAVAASTTSRTSSPVNAPTGGTSLVILSPLPLGATLWSLRSRSLQRILLPAETAAPTPSGQVSARPGRPT
jgi:hypothetical protein